MHSFTHIHYSYCMFVALSCIHTGLRAKGQLSIFFKWWCLPGLHQIVYSSDNFHLYHNWTQTLLVLKWVPPSHCHTLLQKHAKQWTIFLHASVNLINIQLHSRNIQYRTKVMFVIIFMVACTLFVSSELLLITLYKLYCSSLLFICLWNIGSTTYFAG